MSARRSWVGAVVAAGSVGLGLGAAALALPASAQTGGGSTTTTAPTTTTAGGTVHAAATCSANSATTYVTAVTTTASAGGCSDGAGHQVVNITASFTLAGTQGSYNFNQPFILNGNGFTIDANNASRVIVNGSGFSITINNLTLKNGTDGGGRGGALRSNGGAVIVNGSTFQNNNATNGGGAISVDNATITITNSQFLGNKDTGDHGGAIREHGPGGGTAPAITITGSTFSGNSETSGNGGAINSEGPVSLVNSTVTGNSVTSVTASGGGIAARGVSLAYTDVFKNTAATPVLGSDVFIRVGTSLKAFASVIWGSTCSYQSIPIGTSYGYNYLQDTSCFPGGTAAPNATDKVSTADPMLGALANNGGPTLTLLPAPGSPLIDGVPAAACQTAPLATGVTVDQRGLPRPDSASPNCDIGAVEVQPPPPALVIQPRFTG